MNGQAKKQKKGKNTEPAKLRSMIAKMEYEKKKKEEERKENSNKKQQS